MKNMDLTVYLVLDPDLCQPVGMVETALAAVRGGATAVQLRDKRATTKERIITATALKATLAGTGALLIINDDVDAAIAVGADGIHIGQTDLPAAITRARVGPDMIVGLSVETEELARRVDPSIVDYLGIGPVFATPTKANHEVPIGFDGLATIVAATSLPAVAIGGLKAIHAAAVVAAGARGMAVVSAICGQADPQSAASAIAAAIDEART